MKITSRQEYQQAMVEADPNMVMLVEKIEKEIEFAVTRGQVSVRIHIVNEIPGYVITEVAEIYRNRGWNVSTTSRKMDLR